MNGGSSIIGIHGDAVDRAPHADVEPAETHVVDAHPASIDVDQVWSDGEWEDKPSSPWRIVGPVALAIVSLAWVGGMLWLARAALPTMPAPALAQFIAALCVVPMLAGIVWLVALRSSTAEAQRFGKTARAMRAEADSLEQRVAALSQTIAANRDALADQIRALTAIGDSATQRLAAIGRNLSEEIDQADINARSLDQSATVAHNQLSVLLSTMPRVQAEAEALGQMLDDSALSVSRHASALDAQVVALADRGREAEVVAGGAAQKLAAHIARMEATSETASTRLESVTAEMAAAVDQLLDRTAQAVDESRKGIAAQGDAMLAMVGANQAALDSAARGSAEALAERIAGVEALIDRIAQRLEVQRRSGDAIVGQLESGLAGVHGQLDTLHTQGVERSQMLAASISALGGSADAMTEALKAGDTMATRAIGTAESLLIALDASAREIDETLPDALDRLDQRIHASRSVVGAAKPELMALVTAAESTHDAIEAVAQVIADQRRTVDQLSGTLLETLNSGRAKADALGIMVEETIGQANRFADEAAPRLLDALLRVRDTASAAAERARETLATVIPEAAEALEAASGDAMRRATESGVEVQVKAIADVAEAAVGAASRASERLERQIQAIADATAIVETRIEADIARREDADRDSFARRASLLIEAMNSAAIDITRTFGPEVADSAWAAYLKGDRGVFTRRAVRLLDANEQRDIARLYDDDASFRDQVNRYIHDFESMLRTILAQRDGSPLGVTLLSSDMGKLYVALAQAIERLR
ncbi:conserved hypothetical protein [Sphingomonas sp. EC-HK361]|uniref:hypothetical protein n=1 Tax=Sphingomonas sp. EC-HK361 TaxID=2038397 RepID=UPI00125C844D|nr:hypothetical protein [Sphingomonas sp. EC-HK361]VVT07047.1 conserved hypothetical protein [Sphingomonas sp. EC-HK361]